MTKTPKGTALLGSVATSVVWVLLSAVNSAGAHDLNVSGESSCPPGYDHVTPEEARARQADLCQLLGVWGISRLANGGSMDGPGYGCGIRDGDGRPLGEALCTSLPPIHNVSSAPNSRVHALVARAIDGLGMGMPKAPRAEDRVFVGKWYIAWIDQTGFYGKLNGLWPLNGNSGDLQFTLLDGSRPINLLVPGEMGDGAWPGGYAGGEHIEFPNRTPEANDNPGCANGDWCNQYGHSEASDITDSDIPWWGACNTGKPTFDEFHGPSSLNSASDQLTLWYLGPLVKIADGDGTWDGDECHRDYLFPDNVRRRVWLHTGFQLYADKPYVDRLMKLENPAGNPTFSGPMSLIGGYVVTRWPNPAPQKQFNAYWRPEENGFNLGWGGQEVRLEAHTWNALPSNVPTNDVLVGWARQPLSLSTRNAYSASGTLTVSEIGALGNQDVGACLCFVHGGIEMGGGLLANTTLAGGTSSAEARRRLQTRKETTVYQAETDLNHHAGLGYAEADGWAAATGPHSAGHMAFGPYATTWGDGPVRVAFRLLVDVADARQEAVVSLDLFDATSGHLLAQRDVLRSDFSQAFVYQDFVLEANLAGRAGHAMEARVYWNDISYVRLDYVSVDTVVP